MNAWKTLIAYVYKLETDILMTCLFWLTPQISCHSYFKNSNDSHPINITPVKNNNKPRKALIVERFQSLKKDGNNNQKTTPLIFEMHLRGHSVYKKENWLTSNEEKVVFLKILYEDIFTSHTDCLLIIDHVFTFIF